MTYLSNGEGEGAITNDVQKNYRISKFMYCFELSMICVCVDSSMKQNHLICNFKIGKKSRNHSAAKTLVLYTTSAQFVSWYSPYIQVNFLKTRKLEISSYNIQL